MTRGMGSCSSQFPGRERSRRRVFWAGEGAPASKSTRLGHARSRLSIYPVGLGQDDRLLQIEWGASFLGMLGMMSSGRGHETKGLE